MNLRFVQWLFNSFLPGSNRTVSASVVCFSSLENHANSNFRTHTPCFSVHPEFLKSFESKRRVCFAKTLNYSNRKIDLTLNRWVSYLWRIEVKKIRGKDFLTFTFKWRCHAKCALTLTNLTNKICLHIIWPPNCRVLGKILRTSPFLLSRVSVVDLLHFWQNDFVSLNHRFEHLNPKTLAFNFSQWNPIDVISLDPELLNFKIWNAYWICQFSLQRDTCVQRFRNHLDSNGFKWFDPISSEMWNDVDLLKELFWI